jgi:hypothetical protein
MLKMSIWGRIGFIQCLVSWKSSLFAMENLVGGELRQRCEELFRKRYGHQELQRRAAKSSGRLGSDGT